MKLDELRSELMRDVITVPEAEGERKKTGMCWCGGEPPCPSGQCPNDPPPPRKRKTTLHLRQSKVADAWCGKCGSDDVALTVDLNSKAGLTEVVCIACGSNEIKVKHR